jgi:hypothetical protein
MVTLCPLPYVAYRQDVGGDDHVMGVSPVLELGVAGRLFDTQVGHGSRKS